MKYDKYLKEVTDAMCRAGKGCGTVPPNAYRSELPHIADIKVPAQRKINKEGFSFYKKSPREIDKVWDYIYKRGKYHEVLSQPLMYYSDRRDKLDLSHWKFLKTWVSRIDNWAHSDVLSGIYAELHEKYPGQIYPVFKKWNKSSKPWLRRISIVSLFYYADLRKKQPSFNKVLPLVNNLLHDEHIYVQKGVGWTLRELYNVYPEKTYKYLVKHAADLKPASWQAATEKLSQKDKAYLKKLRNDKKSKNRRRS